MRAAILALSATLAACGGGDAPAAPEAPAPAPQTQAVDALHMYILDCGVVEVADLDIFSSAGDYAGMTDTFTDTCFLIRHPDGDLMWDLGLPGILAGGEPQADGVFTVSLEKTLTEQLNTLGLFPSDVEYVSISHSHFDHVGQIDQLQDATWLVHEAEYLTMFPPTSDADEEVDQNAAQFIAFDVLQTTQFSGEYDVFGDGSVLIFETPGHTPGHTSLQVNLPETGPVLLVGDLYHREESRRLRRVPRFNADEARTLASMEAFEARADALGATVIIQHDPGSVGALPQLPDALR